MDNKNIFPKHLDIENLRNYCLKFIMETNGWFENLIHLSEDNPTTNKESNPYLFTTKGSNKINFQIESNILDKFGHLLLCDDSTSLDIEPKLISTPVIDDYLFDMQNSVIQLCKEKRLTFLRKLPWPKGLPFAISISHDVDIIRQYGFRDLLIATTKREGKSVKKIILGLIPSNNRYWNFDDLLNLYHQKKWLVSFYFIARCFEGKTYRYNINSKKFLNLFNKILNDGHEICLHSSKYAYDHSNRYIQEKDKLEENVGKKVIGIRQHYLRILFPKAWEIFEKAGFLYDSSCGYNSDMGFRAGTTFPFLVYNQFSNKTGQLYEIPFVIMDYPWKESSTTINDGMQNFKILAQLVKKNQGLMQILWHPHNIIDSQFYPFWEKMNEWITTQNAYFNSLENILDWWLKRKKVQLKMCEQNENKLEINLYSETRVDNLALEIFSLRNIKSSNENVQVFESDPDLFIVSICTLNIGSNKIILNYN